MYPAFVTASMSDRGEVPSGTKMWAVSVAKLTVARAPGTLFSDFSTVATQDEQVIPEIDRSTCSKDSCSDILIALRYCRNEEVM